MTTKTTQRIHISMDQVWTGDGDYSADFGITDCGAQFCDDNDESLKVYDAIEGAIAAGKTSLSVTLDGADHEITWWMQDKD